VEPSLVAEMETPEIMWPEARRDWAGLAHNF